MDFDADGRKDVITGCFEGCVYLIRGLEDGKFAKPEQVKDADGEILRLGQYWDYDESEWTGVESSEFKEYLGIAAHAVDFDADGDLDLLLGSNEGYFFVRENIGSKKEPKYATESKQLFAADSNSSSTKDESDKQGKDGDALTTGNNHAMPIAADWDGDGLFDVLSGASNGSVVWARNIGEKGSPKFAAMKTLIEAGTTGEDDIQVGSRSQVAVHDYNGDGKLDVAVGDYSSSNRPSKDVVKRKEEIQEKLEDSDSLEEDEIEELESELQKLARPKRTRHGYVWLFVQK